MSWRSIVPFFKDRIHVESLVSYVGYLVYLPSRLSHYFIQLLFSFLLKFCISLVKISNCITFNYTHHKGFFFGSIVVIIV